MNLTATVGATVPLDGSLSSDADGNPLTYHWAIGERPAGSYAVIANSDKVQASFIPDQPGSYRIRLVVSDGTAFSAPAFVTVTASYVLVPVPNVVGEEQGSAEAKIAAASLAVGAITTAPSASVASGAVISQLPLANSSAPKGSRLDLVVSSGPAIDRTLPEIDLQFDASPPFYGQGEQVTILASASDDSGSVSVTLTVDGQPLPLVAGMAKPDPAGLAAGTTHNVVVTAVDPSGNRATKTAAFGIKIAADTAPPEVMILSPAEGQELTGPVTIGGTVHDDHLLRYTLAYSPAGEGIFTEFASGSTPVTNGTLGTFDPTILKNGVYDIRLSAMDVNGRSSVVIVPYLVSGNQKVGLFSLTFTDVDIPVSGIPVTVNRTYDSRDKKSGDFGIGWNLDLSTITIRPNRSLGEAGWYYIKNPGAFDPTYRLVAGLPRFVTVTFGDGRTETFDIAPFQRNADPTYWPAPSFIAREGTTSRLEILDGEQTLILEGDNLYNSDFSIYNPTLYQLTTKEGVVYQLSVKDGLKSLREPGGNKLTVTPAGVSHSAGVSLTFVRDASKRISRIIRPDGAILKYDYDFRGNLSAFTDAAGNTTRFSYTGASNLSDIVSPLGRSYVKNEYDNSGRLIATIDPQGKRIEYTHNTGSRQEIVRDRSGKITVYEYDSKGNVTATTDPDGNRSSATFDNQNNKTGETDPLGNSTAWSYDSQRNLLSETKTINGQQVITRYTYNPLGKILTTTDPLGRITTNTYDSAGRLLTTKDPLNNITSYTYDYRGNLLTTTDPLGSSTSSSYDALGRKLTDTTAAGTSSYRYDTNGNKTAETDARGNTTTYAYNPNNKLTTTTDALGNVSSYEYDANGNKTAEADQLGSRTAYAYDSANRLILTSYADASLSTGNTTTATSYDNEGNTVSRTDQQGRVTRYPAFSNHST